MFLIPNILEMKPEGREPAITPVENKDLIQSLGSSVMILSLVVVCRYVLLQGPTSAPILPPQTPVLLQKSDITNKGLCSPTHPNSTIRRDDPLLHAIHSATHTLRTLLSPSPPKKNQNCRTTLGILIITRSDEPADQQHTAVHQRMVLLPFSISSTNSHMDCEPSEALHPTVTYSSA